MISPLDYRCSNCQQYYLIYDGVSNISPKKYAQLKQIIEQQVKLGYCKNCHRKDPNTPTTLEIDGIITKDDIDNRNRVVVQCRDCKKWTQMKLSDQMVYNPCGHCDSKNFDTTSIKSLRTYNEVTDNKRKPKLKK